MFRCRANQCGIRRSFGAARSREAQSRAVPGDEVISAAAQEFRLASGESLAAASQSQPLVLVFLRHFGCTFTRQLLRGLEELEQTAATQGAKLVLVHMLRSGQEVQYLSGHDQVARIADPECRLYRAFGLGRGGWLEMFGPRVWWLGAIAIFKGCGVGHLAGDGWQMPGAFVFHRGRIVSAQRATSASDMPDLRALFRTAATAGPENRDALPHTS
jgi:hypothetical protein